jgi:hypothetical protein
VNSDILLSPRQPYGGIKAVVVSDSLGFGGSL